MLKAASTAMFVLGVLRCGVSPSAEESTVPTQAGGPPQSESSSEVQQPVRLAAAGGTQTQSRPMVVPEMRAGALIDVCIDDDFFRFKEATLAAAGDFVDAGNGQAAIDLLETHKHAFQRCSDETQWRWRTYMASAYCLMESFDEALDMIYELRALGAKEEMYRSAEALCLRVGAENNRRPIAHTP